MSGGRIEIIPAYGFSKEIGELFAERPLPVQTVWVL